jgi:U3 small nucleolar ribonucleoprotein component
MPQQLTDEIIDAAIEGFESQKVRLDQKIAELQAMRSGDHAGTAAASEASPRRRKKFSAAARRKIALAQKARWARIKGES